jgi:hypothetical protein
MNLNALTIDMMLNITERWLGDADFVDAIEQTGPLGIAIVAQLEKAHTPLAELDNKRVAAEATLRELVDRASTLDVLHDRKARSVYHHLQGFIEGADDPKLVAEYRAMEALLFPIGLRVVQLPYIEEGGAAVALDRAVGPDQRAKFASIKVGEQTMASLFKAWIQAGHEVGAAVSERADLKASLIRERAPDGELDLKAGRGQWIQAIRGLLWALEVESTLASVAKRVHATLEEAIATALRRRVGLETDSRDADADVPLEAPTPAVIEP